MVPVRVRVTSLRSVTSTASERCLAVALIQILLLAGCAGGKKLSYSDTLARIDASGTARVAATAYDQRKLITSGQEPPTFIGREVSLYHSATVTTASGRPLGDDLTNLLATSLAAKGFKAIPVLVSHSESSDAVLQRMAIMRIDRGVVLTVADWRTDTRTDNNNKTRLIYDLDLQILNASGQVLAHRRLAGHDEEMSGAARDAFRQKLELLINSPELTQALSVSESPATAEPAAPTPPAAPGPPAASGQPPATPPAPDVATQLQKLKELYEKGLVTEDLYKEKMREILNKL
ncbi:MAG: hypothetical protein C5B48_15645 [Candidatus Rokuibacteriota bacterium]|nr:MAG: hypothetical protein C5B48_15645 [Candidatus Rokubacteria bacterium]